MSSLNRQRLWWLATCAIFVACASGPTPTPTKAKKKKKKRSKDTVALKKHKDERHDDEEQPDKPERDKADKDKHVASADDDEVKVSDDDEDTGHAKTKKKKSDAADEEVAAKKKKQTDEAEEETASKKKKKKVEEAAEAEEETASKKKKKKVEEAADVEAAGDEVAADEAEEPAPKSKKKPKPTKAAAKKRKAEETKAAAKKRKAEEETEVAAKPAEDEAATEEPVEAEEPKPTKKRKPEKPAKAPAKTADVDMSGGGDGPVIDMEDTGSGSNLDSRVDDAPPERRAVAIAVPGVDSETDTPVEDTTPVGTNPRVINERPLTLAKSKLSVHGGLRVGVLTLETTPGMKTSSTSQGLALGVNYGTSDSTEVGLDYTVGISPGSVKGPLTLHGAYRAYHSGKLDLAVAAAAAVDFSDVTDPMTMQTSTRTAFSIELGAWARYRINRKASVFSGLPALPASTVSLSKLSFALPPLPYQLAIGLNDGGTTALDLPVGVAYQITPKVYAFGMLNLAHLKITNTANAFLFKDFIPLALGGFYALDKLDIGVLFSDDLKQGTDYLRFDTVVRYSIK